MKIIYVGVGLLDQEFKSESKAFIQALESPNFELEEFLKPQ